MKLVAYAERRIMKQSGKLAENDSHPSGLNLAEIWPTASFLTAEFEAELLNVGDSYPKENSLLALRASLRELDELREKFHFMARELEEILRAEQRRSII